MIQKDPLAKSALKVPPLPRTWDGRAARWLVTPLVATRVTPNHLTTLRLAIGFAGALCLARGGFALANVGAGLIVLSNFVDHTDGELARISGKTSRFGHFYDLAADALVTILLFFGMGYGVGARRLMQTQIPTQTQSALPDLAGLLGVPGLGGDWQMLPAVSGGVAGLAVALIFFLRMRIEEIAGKAGTKQAFVGGFETEDVLYLLPLVTLTGVTDSFVSVASIGAPLFALWVAVDYWRVRHRTQRTYRAQRNGGSGSDTKTTRPVEIGR